MDLLGSGPPESIINFDSNEQITHNIPNSQIKPSVEANPPISSPLEPTLLSDIYPIPFDQPPTKVPAKGQNFTINISDVLGNDQYHLDYNENVQIISSASTPTSMSPTPLAKKDDLPQSPPSTNKKPFKRRKRQEWNMIIDPLEFNSLRSNLLVLRTYKKKCRYHNTIVKHDAKVEQFCCGESNCPVLYKQVSCSAGSVQFYERGQHTHSDEYLGTGRQGVSRKRKNIYFLEEERKFLTDELNSGINPKRIWTSFVSKFGRKIPLEVIQNFARNNQRKVRNSTDFVPGLFNYILSVKQIDSSPIIFGDKIGTGTEEDPLFIGITTKTMLLGVSKAGTNALLVLDGTHILSIKKFSLLVIGTTDMTRVFHPFAYMISSRNDTSGWGHFFQTFQAVFIEHYPNESLARFKYFFLDGQSSPLSHLNMFSNDLQPVPLCSFSYVFREVVKKKTFPDNLKESIRQTILRIHYSLTEDELVQNFNFAKECWHEHKEWSDFFFNTFGPNTKNPATMNWMLLKRPEIRIDIPLTKNPIEDRLEDIRKMYRKRASPLFCLKTFLEMVKKDSKMEETHPWSIKNTHSRLHYSFFQLPDNIINKAEILSFEDSFWTTMNVNVNPNLNVHESNEPTCIFSRRNRTYSVTLNRCSCVKFYDFGYCKHIIALSKRLRNENTTSENISLYPSLNISPNSLLPSPLLESQSHIEYVPSSLLPPTLLEPQPHIEYNPSSPTSLENPPPKDLHPDTSLLISYSKFTSLKNNSDTKQ